MQNKPDISHYLGIDYGKAKIGLAIADSETRIATAYGTLKNDASLFEKLMEIVKKEGINKIIIGVNEVRGSTSSPLEVEPRIRFEVHLKSKLKTPIEYQDEMFTTKMAEHNLKEKGAKKIKRFDDQEAARIILQSWLDRPSQIT